MPLLIKIRITRSNRGNVLGNFPYFHIKHIVDGTRKNCLSKAILMTSVAQLDARPTVDQEVAGSNPAGSATFFRKDLIMKYFLLSFSPFR